MAGPERNQAAIAALRARFGARLSTSAAVREQHGKDESYHAPQAPDAVVFVQSIQEITETVRICAAHHTPLIPFGAGTSLEGHVAALRGGVCLDLSGMNRILAVNAEDGDCVVEAGVTRKTLNEYIRDTGLFFPIDPGADATLGGMAATSASGTNAVRYGGMRENVLGLTVVLADGRVVRTARRARKSSSGYDLTRLFVGSEGTLGVIAEVSVKLHPVPEAISAATCRFPDVGNAVNATIATIQSGLPVARIELIDEISVKGINRYSGLSLPERPCLFLEFHGTEAGVREQAQRFGEIAAEYGGGDFDWATKTEVRNKLWEARHTAYYASLAMYPGKKGMPTDVCVPISRLAECIAQTRRDLADSGIEAPIIGHVGDGNFHTLLIFDPDDPAEVARCKAFNERLIARALAMDGTCTGEHGVGYGKIGFMEAEHGEGASVMRAVKQALDPHNLMNPGKVVRV
ncbi:MAG: FAD-binding oxidoreductase [Pseudomonadota bacterium]|jgi:D-lactate dehydrogenase (cytochrome)